MNKWHPVKDRFSLKNSVDPHSLKFQLLARSLFFLAIILILIGIFQYVFLKGFILSSTASSIRSQMASVPRETWTQMLIYAEINANFNLENGPGELAPGRNPENAPKGVPVNLMDSAIAYVDLNGNLTPLNGAGNSSPSPQLSAAHYQKALLETDTRDYMVVKTSEGEELMVLLQPLNFRGHLIGQIQVSMSTQFVNDVLFRQVFIFMMLSLLALAGGLVAYQAVIKRTLVPLSNVVDTMESIDAGNLDERLPVAQGQTEIDSLAESLNGMLERLESSFAAEKEAKEQMRRFVADASHELRTPLTSIHGFLEVLLRGAMNQPDKLDKSLKSMYDESERMKKLIQDLLLLARLDRSPDLEKEEKDLKSLILEMEPQLRMLAEEREVQLALASVGPVSIDVDKIKQVILNLFQNAVQHTDQNQGSVRLSLQSVGTGVELAVEDNGPGITEDHVAHLFERFYRSDSSRARKYGGSGLGLAITQSLVELHGGTIRVESKVGEGSRFIVRLPKA
ncbi:signal transduction histidine kinase [Desulfitobacterium dichloroeliminans LMG P-21439]|uniref:histidine kinase n=1 Tax=Desulfitobacterium dichloroeliminans (strain LMG P-21439 / DCA1) TaxID=871963 RepID=L0F5M9_DESDL|nr:HAMP domain-containing sensor histidine kinase [Desulfitobacterium dichloroeliminans]AGA68350.1 signal transduction histidine kinase [Desulfitobacterium dichloroeliminans LMG P-21439]